MHSCYRTIDAALDTSVYTMGDCHVRIDAATGFSSRKTLGSLNCAVGKTCNFMHPTGLEL